MEFSIGPLEEVRSFCWHLIWLHPLLRSGSAPFPLSSLTLPFLCKAGTCPTVLVYGGGGREPFLVPCCEDSLKLDSFWGKYDIKCRPLCETKQNFTIFLDGKCRAKAKSVENLCWRLGNEESLESWNLKCLLSQNKDQTSLRITKLSTITTPSNTIPPSCLDHRLAPIESVAMSKQRLPVMISKFPAT